MMFTKLLMLTVGMLLPAALALPNPGAPSNPHAPAQGVSPLVAEALTHTTKTAKSAAGRCTFHARVHQQCAGSSTKTYIAIDSFRDNADKVILEPAEGLPVALDDGVWRMTALEQDFWVSFEHGNVRYIYGHAHPNDMNNGFTCIATDWSDDELKCGLLHRPMLRKQDMDCSFLCGVMSA